MSQIEVVFKNGRKARRENPRRSPLKGGAIRQSGDYKQYFKLDAVFPPHLNPLPRRGEETGKEYLNPTISYREERDGGGETDIFMNTIDAVFKNRRKARRENPRRSPLKGGKIHLTGS